MKKLLLLLPILLLTSCGEITPKDIEEQKKYCDSIGLNTYNRTYSVECRGMHVTLPNTK